MSFSATRTEEEDDHYELAWCHTEEVRLYGSLIVGAHPEHGKIFIYPMRWAIDIEDIGQDLSSMVVLDDICIALKRRVADRFEAGRDVSIWEELPPFLKNRPYQINSNLQLSQKYQVHILESIDTRSDLMIRGISHMVKCGMLTRLGRAFFDTACLEIYVALEATLEIIRERLRESGNSNPSTRDASDYLLTAFDATYRLDRYYGDFYDDRIKAIHPNSRFGSARFTPLHVDDLYMLYNDLLRNFEFLITGVPNCYTRY